MEGCSFLKCSGLYRYEYLVKAGKPAWLNQWFGHDGYELAYARDPPLGLQKGVEHFRAHR